MERATLILEGIAHRDLKPQNPTTARPTHAEAVAVVTLNPANNAGPIETEAEETVTDRETRRRFVELYRAERKSDQVLEADTLAAMRKGWDLMKPAVASVALRAARGKPADDPVRLMWWFAQNGPAKGYEEGAIAGDWSEIDRNVHRVRAAARRPSRRSERVAEEPKVTELYDGGRGAQDEEMRRLYAPVASVASILSKVKRDNSNGSAIEGVK